MLVGGVVDDKLGNYFQVSFVRFLDKLGQLADISIGGIDILIIRNIVAIIA